MRLFARSRPLPGRAATSAEIERARAFLADFEVAYRESIRAVPPTQTVKSGDKTAKPAPMQTSSDEFSLASETIPEPRSDQPKDARTAAWMSFVQALFGSAEFRFLR